MVLIWSWKTEVGGKRKSKLSCQQFEKYSFWQNTLNKAFPGSAEAIGVRQMLEVQKNQTWTTYCTRRQHHTFIKISTRSRRRISEHRGILFGKTRKKKRAHTTSYKSWVVSVPRRLFLLLFPNKKKTDPCWIRQCRAESRSSEK